MLYVYSDSDTSLYNLDGYNLISHGKHASASSGLLIYLETDFDFKILALHKPSYLWEDHFVEKKSSSFQHKIVIGNIYRPPRNLLENFETFYNELEPILQKLNSNTPETIITGDFNIDLLKININATFSDFSI